MQVPPEQTFDAAIRDLPESLQGAANNWLDRLLALQPDAQSSFVLASGDVRALIRVVTCSEFAGNIAINQWPWLCACSSSQDFAKPHNKQTLQKRFDARLEAEVDIDSSDTPGSPRKRYPSPSCVTPWPVLGICGEVRAQPWHCTVPFSAIVSS